MLIYEVRSTQMARTIWSNDSVRKKGAINWIVIRSYCTEHAVTHNPVWLHFDQTGKIQISERLLAKGQNGWNCNGMWGKNWSCLVPFRPALSLSCNYLSPYFLLIHCPVEKEAVIRVRSYGHGGRAMARGVRNWKVVWGYITKRQPP